MIEIADLGVKFKLPDKISVRTQMRFWAGWQQSDDAGDYIIIKRWELINELNLLEGWECDYFPDPKVSLDEVEDPRIAHAAVMAVSEVFRHMVGLRHIEKN